MIRPSRLYFVKLAFRMFPETSLTHVKLKMLRWAGVDVSGKAGICSSINILGCGELRIGQDTWLGHECLLVASASIKIGARCDLAPQVTLITGSHELGNSARRAGKGISLPIAIGDGCWIGARSTILGGAVIGSGSIVAAGSLVRPGEYPPDSLLAGVPAMVKKSLPQNIETL